MRNPVRVETTSRTSAIERHYQRVAPTLESTFGAIPIVTAAFPGGLGTKPRWYPKSLPLTPRVVAWCVRRLDAVELHSWTPSIEHPGRVGFARILLEPGANTAPKQLAAAARATRAALAQHDLDAVAVLDGLGGVALFVPFDDAPAYDDVRTWLHQLTNALAASNAIFSTEPNTHAPNAVHIHVAHNAVHAWSVLPYSLRGRDGLPVAVPVRWDELDALPSVTIDQLPARLGAVGDLLASERRRIGRQTFGSLQTLSLAATSHGHVIDAALQILLDGRARSADAIFKEAVAHGLLPADFKAKYVYTALIEYIARAQGNGRRPAIVQDADRSFRFNEPPDDWPNLPDVAPHAPDPQAGALAQRLSETAQGSDPAAFEIAVCDAFAHLGFAATHVGGNKAPDGYIDAQLGVLGYRVMLECKTAKATVSQPDAFEAAKYREPYNAQFCVLIGPAFPNETELTQELKTHGVCAWTADDLRLALALGANAYELRNAFAPGYAADALTDLQWARAHGDAKHVRVVMDILERVGRELQVTAATQGGPATAPLLTVDTAMALVDRELAAAHSTQACTREQVENAFAYLTNPVVAKAVRANEAIVIVSP